MFRKLKFPDQVATLDNISNNIIFKVVKFTGVCEVNEMNNGTHKGILYLKLLEHNATKCGGSEALLLQLTILVP